MDKWIRWTYKVNGWQWSLMQGAEVIAEGASRSKRDAEYSARVAELEYAEGLTTSDAQAAADVEFKA